MPDFLKNALEWLKTPARYFLPLVLVAGFLLYRSEPLLEPMGLYEWSGENQTYIALVFLFSTAVVFIEYGRGAILLLWEETKEFRKRRRMKRSLHFLTPEEKGILSSYMQENSKTRYMYAHSGVVGALVGKDILYSAAAQGPLNSFPFTISDGAWDYLKKNLHLLDGGITLREKEKRI